MSSLFDPDFTPTDPGSVDYSEGINVSRTHAAIAREKVEPRAGFEPIPIWLTALCCFIAFIGGGYLFANSAGFQPDVYNAAAYTGAAENGAPGAPGAPGGAAPVPEDPMVLGQKFFSANCMSCHQSSGLGVPGQYPPLAGSEYTKGDVKRNIAIVLHGLQGPLTVGGGAFNGQMQAWQTNLNDKKIACILTYVRQSWGNNGSPVTPEMVAEVRKETAAHDAPLTEAELKAFPK